MKLTESYIRDYLFRLGRKSPTLQRDLNKVIEISMLTPMFIEEPPKGLCATMYHTGIYSKDLELHNRLKDLVELY